RGERAGRVLELEVAVRDLPVADGVAVGLVPRRVDDRLRLERPLVHERPRGGEDAHRREKRDGAALAGRRGAPAATRSRSAGSSAGSATGSARGVPGASSANATKGKNHGR